MIQFYVPHLEQSGGVAHIFRVAAGLARRNYDVEVVDVSERCVASAWFEEPLKIVPPSARHADISFMYGDGPGHLATGKRFLFLLGKNVWDTQREMENKKSRWDGVLCGSKWLAEDTKKWFGGPVAHAQPGVDPRLTRVREAEPWTVGLLAHRSPFKRTYECLKNVEPLKKRGLKILAYGPGNHPAIDEHVGRPTFEELAHLYSRCAVWLMPSSNEGFALPPLEAAACGAVPLVADDSPYDLLTWVRRPLGGFANEVAALCADNERRVRLAAAARNEAMEFTWERTVDCAEAFIKEAP